MTRMALPRQEEIRSIRSMRRVKQIVVLLLVALWLPASSHALLEHAGFIHHEHEHAHEHEPHSDFHHHDAHPHPEPDGRHEHNGDNHAAADGLCLLASAKVQVPTPDFTTADGWLTAVLLPLPDDDSGTANHSGLSPPGTAPPELPHIWQFSFRTALPARAPSLVS